MLSPCIRFMGQQRLGECYIAAEVFGYCLHRNVMDPQPYVCLLFFFFFLFPLWSTLLHYSGRAVAHFCLVICCTTVASGSLRLFVYLGSSSFIFATLQCVPSELICWVCSVALGSPRLATLPSGSGVHGLLFVVRGCSQPPLVAVLPASARLYKES